MKSFVGKLVIAGRSTSIPQTFCGGSGRRSLSRGQGRMPDDGRRGRHREPHQWSGDRCLHRAHGRSALRGCGCRTL